MIRLTVEGDTLSWLIILASLGWSFPQRRIWGWLRPAPFLWLSRENWMAAQPAAISSAVTMSLFL